MGRGRGFLGTAPLVRGSPPRTPLPHTMAAKLASLAVTLAVLSALVSVPVTSHASHLPKCEHHPYTTADDPHISNTEPNTVAAKGNVDCFQAISSVDVSVFIFFCPDPGGSPPPEGVPEVQWIDPPYNCSINGSLAHSYSPAPTTKKTVRARAPLTNGWYRNCTVYAEFDGTEVYRYTKLNPTGWIYLSVLRPPARS